jgi:phage N-6-adenine-methyltransferase
MNKVHFSSRTDQYSTPQWLFDLLNAEKEFDLDVCGVPTNAKCKRFFSPDMDGLSQDWGKNRCWMNPPYGREIGRWVEKAYLSSLAGAEVLALLPARVYTSWWFSFCLKAEEIRFLKGRLRFGGQPDNKAENCAPFPSAIVIWTPGKHKQPRVRFVDLKEVQRSLFGC